MDRGQWQDIQKKRNEWNAKEAQINRGIKRGSGESSKSKKRNEKWRKLVKKKMEQFWKNQWWVSHDSDPNGMQVKIEKAKQHQRVQEKFHSVTKSMMRSLEALVIFGSMFVKKNCLIPILIQTSSRILMRVLALFGSWMGTGFFSVLEGGRRWRGSFFIGLSFSSRMEIVKERAYLKKPRLI